MLARIDTGKVAELRKIALSDIPPHKRDFWLPVEGEPPAYDPERQTLKGPVLIVEPSRVVRVFTIEPRTPQLADYEAAIDGLLDAAARSRGYKSEASILSYAVSANPAWSAEAQAFAAWRDAVWLAAYSLLAAVNAGQTEAPTVSELVESIPAIKWPAG